MESGIQIENDYGAEAQLKKMSEAIAQLAAAMTDYGILVEQAIAAFTQMLAVSDYPPCFFGYSNDLWYSEEKDEKHD
jgi:hypothetical protein